MIPLLPHFMLFPFHLVHSPVRQFQQPGNRTGGQLVNLYDSVADRRAEGYALALKILLHVPAGFLHQDRCSLFRLVRQNRQKFIPAQAANVFRPEITAESMGHTHQIAVPLLVSQIVVHLL